MLGEGQRGTGAPLTMSQSPTEPEGTKLDKDKG
jgi:hypothetical protein